MSWGSATHAGLCLSADGVGERLCGHRHADPPLGERRQAMLPLLAGRGLQPLPRLRGTSPGGRRGPWAWGPWAMEGAGGPALCGRQPLSLEALLCSRSP